MRVAVRGTLLALASAAAFGVTTPLVQRVVRSGVGAFTAAALLYAGAAAVGFATRTASEAPPGRSHAPRLLVVAALGAFVAPALLAFGLGRASGTAASLMLNLEALFTIALARLVHREHVGRRVMAAAVALFGAGALLALDGSRGGEMLGAVAVAGAALAWATDNALSKPLSLLDPAAVVGAKGATGAALSVGLAVVTRERWPSASALLALGVLGATGYGASLRLYLRAQRSIGAGRTASVFAAGPFLGALVAWAMGEVASPLTLVAALGMAVGLALHLTEDHGHPHVHEATEHEHAHRHDDGHHDHVHDPVPVGEHTHVHRHDRRVHDHAHLPDVHHEHGHD